MFALFLIGIYGRIIAYLPPWCVSFLCAVLTKVALATSLKDRVQRGILRFPWSADPDVETLTKRHIRFLVDMFHSMLYFRYHRRPLPGATAKITSEGAGYLREAVEKTKGVILVSLHLGNFFCSMAYLASAYPVNLIVRGESDPRWEAFSLRMRTKTGIKSVYSEGGALKMKELLRKGELLIFIVDQYILPFFHGPNHPFREVVPRLAQLTDAPVIPFLTLHDGNHIIVRFLPPLERVSPSGLEDMLIQMVKENPHLWFWWRRMGKVKRSDRTS